jgi:outer membrane protein assembly factor BamB
MQTGVGKTGSISKLLSVFFIFMIIFNFPSVFSEWPMFLHDAQNTGNSTSTGPLSDSVLWMVPNLGGNSYSSPAVANGRVFINKAGSGILYSLFENNGTEIWNFVIGTSGSDCSTPAIYEGKVYIVGDRLYCLYENNGTEVWRKSVSGAGVGTSSPTVVDERVYLNTQILYCLYAENGTEIWNKSVGGDMDSSTPAVVNNKVFVNANKLYCFYAENGTEIWNRMGMESTSPLVSDGKVYWNPNRTFCLYENNGTEIWENSYGGDRYSSPAIYNNRLYLNEEGRIYCFYENNGTELWRTTISGTGCSTPAVDAQGNVYLAGGSYMYCLNGTNGNEIWSVFTGGSGWSSPAIANGRVFVNQGDLYCFGTTPYTIDYVQIHDSPNGSGRNLCDPVNYTSYPGGYTTTFYAAVYNFSAPGDGYLFDVPFTLNWESSNSNVVSVSPFGVTTTISASSQNWGTVIITLDDDDGHSNTTQVTVTEPSTDYILIRDGSNGTGNNLCDALYYPSYLGGSTPTFYGASYNNTVGYLGDVSSSSTWVSDNTSLVLVSSPGESSLITCSVINSGTTVIILDAQDGNTNTTQVTVYQPQTDYVLIRDAPLGGGMNLCDPANYSSYPPGFSTTFYGARYNLTMGFLGDVSSSAQWNSNNTSLVNPSTPGNLSTISCSNSENGTAMIILDAGGGIVNTTQVTVLAASIDYILIRDAPDGGGVNLCDPVNYPSFPLGFSTVFYLAAYNGSNFIGDIPGSWVSTNDTIVNVTFFGSFTSLTCSYTQSGSSFISVLGGFGLDASTIVTVLPPQVDYIQIRNEFAGGGLNLCDSANYQSYAVGKHDAFFGASYNHTAGYLVDVPLGSTWTSSDEEIVEVNTSGSSTEIGCNLTNYGTVTVTLNDGAGHENFTQVIVLRPTVDFILVRDVPSGLGNIIEIFELTLGEEITAIFYCTAYNNTAGYIGEREAQWNMTWNLGLLSSDTGTSTNFTALQPGEETIIADFNDNIFSISIIIYEIDDHVHNWPENLVVEQVPNQWALRLTWDEVIGIDIAGYNIYRATESDGPFELINLDGPVADTTYLDTGCKSKITYYYRVVALDTAQNPSQPSLVENNIPLGKEEEVDDNTLMLFLLMIIPIVIVLLLLFAVLNRRKKEEPQPRTFVETERPPAWFGMQRQPEDAEEPEKTEVEAPQENTENPPPSEDNSGK